MLGPGTGMTQRDGMEKEVGGGAGWGIRVHPWWSHVDVWLPVLSECRQLSTIFSVAWERIRNNESKLQPRSKQVKCWEIFFGGRRACEI